MFCLGHVRAYNRAWDFCRGMSIAEIEAQIRADICWGRPSWSLRANARPDVVGAAWRDPFDLSGAKTGAPRGKRGAPTCGTAESEALAILDLAPPITLAQVKVRYKLMVKRYHPDANGGDKAAEERLKLVNLAYTTLRKGFLS